MPRAIWTGSLSFGLVNVPVGLFSATDDKAIHFNQFQAGTADRIRQKRVNERTGEEVEYAEVVKGYDLGGGEVRHRHARRARSPSSPGAPGPSRNHRLRRPRRHRSHLLQVDVLPRPAGRAGRPALRAVARGDGPEQQGRRRLPGVPHQGAPRHDQADRDGAGPRDHVLRRRDPRSEDRAPRRHVRGGLLRPGAQHGPAADRVDGERVGPDHLRRRVPQARRASHRREAPGQG